MYTTSKPIPYLIEDIVDTLRATGIITDVVVSGLYSTITTDNSLQENENIEIDSVRYPVKDVTSTSFKVKGDLTGATSWKAKAPYFDYGHILEIGNTLLEKGKTNSPVYDKYPLIILQMDYEEDRRDYSKLSISPTFYIITSTEALYKANQRIEKKFIPELYPLYESFIDALVNSNLTNNKNIEHTKIDRVYWGSTAFTHNTKNMIGDHIDAIELNNTQIEFNTTKC